MLSQSHCRFSAGISTALLVCFAGSASAVPQAPKPKPKPKPGPKFALGCKKLPFDAIAIKPDPAGSCGNCGVSAPTDQAKILQNQAKNNFCANAASPVPITFADLRDMQAEAIKNKWVTKTLNDRKPLRAFHVLRGRKIGEGDVVRLAAWVKEAHISDCPGGESVNCEIHGFPANDIHIPLLDPTTGGRDQDECTSITAEMSPHFRPAAWSEVDLKTPAVNTVRVTGPLFFDNAHEACTGAARPAPNRSSLWEIHPVYQLKVCTHGTGCDVGKEGDWMPYDAWVKKPDSRVEETGKKQRECPDESKTPPPAAQCPRP
jgi:hypothetical protein